MQHTAVLIIVVAVAAAGAAACDHTPAVGFQCADVTVPGTVVQQPGIQSTLRNRDGLAVASGVSVTAVNGNATSVSGFIEDSLTAVVFVGIGTYTLRISKPFYRDTMVSNVVVLAGACNGVQPVKLSLVLGLAPNAPRVRSVAVFGTTFLATPGAQTKMVAIVDADAGMSRAVNWRLSDTTLARIDPTGLVAAKCSTRGGTDTVTAVSAADATVSGKTTFGVGVSASCP
jgi:hypothetical protein